MLHLYGDYVAEHVRLLQDVYAAYGARATHASYTYYGYQGEKTIELSGFESGQLWHLLDEAQEVGLPLVHSRASLGEVQRDMHAELCLDANRAGNSMALTPVVVVEGVATDAAPVVFIGTQAHGLVYVDRAEMSKDGQSPRVGPAHREAGEARFEADAAAGSRTRGPEDSSGRSSPASVTSSTHACAT